MKKWFWRIVLFPMWPLIWLTERGDICHACDDKYGCFARAQWMRKQMDIY